jgi:DNA-binding transcriptional ArsR family regulator
MARPALVFDRLGTLADATRGRILLLLEGTELTVGELCSVLQLPQSTVSRHLKILSDEGWIVARDSGPSRF